MASNAGRDAPRQNDPVNPRPPGLDDTSYHVPDASMKNQGKSPRTAYDNFYPDIGYEKDGPITGTGSDPL